MASGDIMLSPACWIIPVVLLHPVYVLLRPKDGISYRALPQEANGVAIETGVVSL